MEQSGVFGYNNVNIGMLVFLVLVVIIMQYVILHVVPENKVISDISDKCFVKNPERWQDTFKKIKR
jgi:uncharacterized membrane protein YukC